MSRHLQIADAVVFALNGHSFSQALTAQRKALPILKREDASTLQVTVVPSTFRCEMADRARATTYYGVDVGVQKAVAAEDLAAFDALFGLLQEIHELFRMKRLEALPVAVWDSTETIKGAETGFAPEHLEKLRTFTGVLRMTFRVIE